MFSTHVRYGNFVASALWLSDLVIVNLLFLAVVLTHPGLAAMPEIRTVWVLVTTAYLPALIWLHTRKMHLRAIVLETEVSKSLFMVMLHALVFIVLLFFLNIDLPLSAIVGYYIMMLVAIPLWWGVTRHILKRMRRRGYNFLRVVVVGAGPTAGRLIESIKSNEGYGLKITGIFSDQPDPGFPYGITGYISDLEEFVAKNDVDQIYYTIAGDKERLISGVLRVADSHMVDFLYVPLISRRISRGFELHSIGPVPVLSIRSNRLASIWNRMLKRGFDIVFSGLFLIVSPVVFIPVAIAVKLSSPGPVFFAQERTGYRGKTFRCLKFRTMRVNDDADTRQATRDDDRTTRVGAFLRRTSLDELPQFINVFLGDMSVVGPRPHMLKHTDRYAGIIDSYMVRHTVKPGVTGWAQVNGYRGITDELWKMEKRVEYDVWYIENWSFLLDLKIILRTFFDVFSHDDNAF